MNFGDKKADLFDFDEEEDKRILSEYGDDPELQEAKRAYMENRGRRPKAAVTEKPDLADKIGGYLGDLGKRFIGGVMEESADSERRRKAVIDSALHGELFPYLRNSKAAEAIQTFAGDVSDFDPKKDLGELIDGLRDVVGMVKDSPLKAAGTIGGAIVDDYADTISHGFLNPKRPVSSLLDTASIIAPAFQAGKAAKLSKLAKAAKLAKKPIAIAEDVTEIIPMAEKAAAKAKKIKTVVKTLDDDTGIKRVFSSRDDMTKTRNIKKPKKTTVDSAPRETVQRLQGKKPKVDKKLEELEAKLASVEKFMPKTKKAKVVKRKPKRLLHRIADTVGAEAMVRKAQEELEAIKVAADSIAVRKGEVASKAAGKKIEHAKAFKKAEGNSAVEAARRRHIDAKRKHAEAVIAADGKLTPTVKSLEDALDEAERMFEAVKVKRNAPDELYKPASEAGKIKAHELPEENARNVIERAKVQKARANLAKAKKVKGDAEKSIRETKAGRAVDSAFSIYKSMAFTPKFHYYYKTAEELAGAADKIRAAANASDYVAKALSKAARSTLNAPIKNAKWELLTADKIEAIAKEHRRLLKEDKEYALEFHHPKKRKQGRSSRRSRRR